MTKSHNAKSKSRTTRKSKIILYMLSVLSHVKSFLSYFILRHIFGWNIKKQSHLYDAYKTGKYVTVYLHTSIYDHIIAALFSSAFDLPFIMIGNKRSNKNTQHAGIGYILYNAFDMVVVDPQKDNTATCGAIVKDLSRRNNFTFLINPEGSIHRTTRIKSGFYQIAKSTQSSVLLFDLNYHTHEVDLREIIPNIIVKTASYERISEIVAEELSKTLPFDSRKTFLRNKVHCADNNCANNNYTDNNCANNNYTDNNSDFGSDVGTIIVDEDLVENHNNLLESSDNYIFASSSQISDTSTSDLKKTGKPTSLLNINKSVLRHVPIIIIIGIVLTMTMAFKFLFKSIGKSVVTNILI